MKLCFWDCFVSFQLISLALTFVSSSISNYPGWEDGVSQNSDLVPQHDFSASSLIPVWSLITKDPLFLPRYDFPAVSFNNKLYVIGGRSNEDYVYNDIWASENGVDWQQTIPQTTIFTPRYLHALTVFHGQLVLTFGTGVKQSFGDVWTTSDGISWDLQAAPPFQPRHGHSTFVFNDQLWVVAGQYQIGGMEWMSLLNDV